MQITCIGPSGPDSPPTTAKERTLQTFSLPCPAAGSSSPGRRPDQAIRWLVLAQASPNQRRRTPFCPSKCPSGKAHYQGRHCGCPQIRHCSSTVTKVHADMQEHRRQARRLHLSALPREIAARICLTPARCWGTDARNASRAGKPPSSSASSDADVRSVPVPGALQLPLSHCRVRVMACLPKLVQVIAQDLGAGRVAQLHHRLGLDLADPLPGNPVDLADLVESLGLAVGQAEPHRDHPGLPLG